MGRLIPKSADLWDGERWCHTRFEVRDNRVILHTGFNRKLQQEFKDSLAGTRWNFFEDKEWSAEFSARTVFSLHFLMNGPLRARYYGPIDKTIQPLIKRELPLYQHQLELYQASVAKRTMMGAYDMGTGKTRVGIELMEYVKSLCRDHKAPFFDSDEKLLWVICPKNLIRTWEAEIRKWDSKIHPLIITNSIQSIKKAVDSVTLPPQCLVVDEISEFRGNSKRTRAVSSLTCRMQLFWEWQAFVLGLSGSIAPKDHEDWWRPMEIVCPGAIRERTPNKFGNRIAVYESIEKPTGGNFPKRMTFKDGVCAECQKPKSEHDSNVMSLSPFNADGSVNLAYWEGAQDACAYYPKVLCKTCSKLHRKHYSCHQYSPSEQEKDEVSILPNRLAPYVIVRKKEHCVDLPERLYIQRNVDPTDEMIRGAGFVLDQCATKLEVLEKLAQYSDGFQYLPEWDDTELSDTVKDTGDKRAILLEHNPKLDEYKRFLEEIAEAGQTRLVSCTTYKASVDMLIAAHLSLGWGVIALDGRGLRGYNLPHGFEEVGDGNAFREQCLEDKIVFLGHPKSMGFGLNLQKSKYIAFYSNSSRWDWRAQAIGRIHRIGMDDGAVTIVDFPCLGPDKLKIEVLENRENTETLTLEQIKECCR